MLTLLSALGALGCVLASGRRLARAVAPSWLDAKALAGALRGLDAGGRSRLEAAIAACPRADWELRLFQAATAPDDGARVALVNEELRELDWRMQGWARAPRVCASIATSAGLLCGCVALLGALPESSEDAVSALLPAIDALAVGIAGASFCIAVHARCRRLVRERLADADGLVERLEARVASPPSTVIADSDRRPREENCADVISCVDTERR
jgi:hypothetical protein